MEQYTNLFDILDNGIWFSFAKSFRDHQLCSSNNYIPMLVLDVWLGNDLTDLCSPVTIPSLEYSEKEIIDRLSNLYKVQGVYEKLYMVGLSQTLSIDNIKCVSFVVHSSIAVVGCNCQKSSQNKKKTLNFKILSLYTPSIRPYVSGRN